MSTDIDASLTAFRQTLERISAEPGVESLIPYKEITRIVTLATGKPCGVTVTTTIWPGTEALEQVWRDAPRKGIVMEDGTISPIALTDSHVAALEDAIRAEGYDILHDTETGKFRLVKTPPFLKSYQYGNSSPELAEEICAAIDPVIDKARGAKRPCGECHLQSGEVCDICGAERADG